MGESAVAERIAPVGELNTGDPIKPEKPAATATQIASAGPRSGEQVYNAACVACHATGAAGAPKTGDEAAWAPRIEKGIDTLLNHAVNGFNAMPPKGTCGDCSEDELLNAIGYMLEAVGAGDMVESTGGAAAEAPEPAAQASAVEPQAAAAEEAGRSGEEVYNSACMACHATGAAGAPKMGDKAAWAPRIDKGMDTLMNHAVNGFNAMPPRGTCAACSDTELQKAVEYMIANSK